jgi:hypothetical protein
MATLAISLVATLATAVFGRSILLCRFCDADSADIFVVNLFEVPKQLSLFAVHVWFLPGSLDNAENTSRLAEDTIHFFKGASSSLGVEEINYGENNSITAKMLAF